MYILVLQRRLNCLLRHMVKSGDWTERGIARVAGVSQPHVHNVLKGVREFSPEISDRIIGRLGISLDDLLQGSGGAHPASFSNTAPRTIPVPILEGRLGAGYPFPCHPSGQWKQLLRGDVEALVCPVVVYLAPDAWPGEILSGSDWALIDTAPDPDLSTAWLCMVQVGAEGCLVRADRLLERRSTDGNMVVRGVCEAVVRARPHALSKSKDGRLASTASKIGSGFGP